ncbi:MAG: type II toxin-antitoxin system VapC family toxin [Taibaiella sp.]|nr:type II toxin-antitoxin system VapC family toxin [Taibaiella sp.]
MSDKYLLETNIVLYILNGEEDLVTFLDGSQLFISIITELELLSYSGITEIEMQNVEAFINDITVIPLNTEVKTSTIVTRKQSKLKLADSIIAASSMVYGMQLVTADKHFKSVNELQLIYYESSNN